VLSILAGEVSVAEAARLRSTSDDDSADPYVI
jgi:hypothetical protein